MNLTGRNATRGATPRNSRQFTRTRLKKFCKCSIALLPTRINFFCQFSSKSSRVCCKCECRDSNRLYVSVYEPDFIHRRSVALSTGDQLVAGQRAGYVLPGGRRSSARPHEETSLGASYKFSVDTTPNPIASSMHAFPSIDSWYVYVLLKSRACLRTKSAILFDTFSAEAYVHEMRCMTTAIVAHLKLLTT